jgi:hypothetical protein
VVLMVGPVASDVPVGRGPIPESDTPDAQPASAVTVSMHSSARADWLACPRDAKRRRGLPLAPGADVIATPESHRNAALLAFRTLAG